MPQAVVKWGKRRGGLLGLFVGLDFSWSNRPRNTCIKTWKCMLLAMFVGLVWAARHMGVLILRFRLGLCVIILRTGRACLPELVVDVLVIVIIGVVISRAPATLGMILSASQIINTNDRITKGAGK